MDPIQLWLPELSAVVGSPEAERDRRRAFRLWRGESVVWLLPWLDKQHRRWQEGQARLLAVRSELLERLEVHHIGRNGCVVGPAGRFRNNRLGDLLPIWLNLHRAPAAFTRQLAKEKQEIRVPVFTKAEPTYETRYVELLPTSRYPSSLDDIDRDHVAPRRPQGKQPVRRHRGTQIHSYVAQAVAPPARLITSTRSTPPSVTPFVLGWPEPLDLLMPVMSGISELLAQQEMATIAERSGEDPDKALIDAKEGANHLILGGSTSVWAAEYGPVFAGGGKLALLSYVRQTLGVSADSVADLDRDDKFRTTMGREISVRRVWGPVGLFWALLIDCLEICQTFQTCHRCRRIIGRTRRNKKFCGQDDDPSCYFGRLAENQRRSRARRSRDSESLPY